ncbi:hypothetical protein CHGG_03439 [Chaetomium globosum CBS 148.51]|uniref:NmrA-like domain-containing protein n=1 Tax=Chaetomium globosum (strain ATCC 6205 / CBS 148.51 / DSM 1962 / NBRC 6347 / NRRL 1970) TaxID=306901 RepID=Q2H8L5_CHAGB|nr:uncharacterized protein CHGG_03439 [Chaetomium globosum CBS 148.51]EAQ91504.1 hypothetical protein CHGG_03439 [Chaetomium globosum CBS 148.51]
MTNPTVFVCGATGAQGGRLAHRLRAIGWGVHTTVRDPSSPAAQSLQSIGVETTPGDWNNEAALAHSLTGCQMLFLNPVPPPLPRHPPRTCNQAQTLLRLALAAHIHHVVYSSSIPLPTTDPTSLPALARASKRHIETATRSAGIPVWTILRPAFFMTNLVRPNVDRLFPGASATGEFTLALRPDTPLALIDPDDIAQFAVAAFRAPGRFHGQVVDLAGEVRAVGEVLAVLAGVVGRGVRGRYLREEEVEERKGVEVFLSGQLDLKEAAPVDVGRVRSWGVEMGTLEGELVLGDEVGWKDDAGGRK